MRTALRKRDVPFCAVALVCLSLADSSPAQPALAEDGEDAAIEEIVVTGSRIPRRDFYSPSPLITLDREALDATGRRTLEETLNQMPQVQPDLNRSLRPGKGLHFFHAALFRTAN